MKYPKWLIYASGVHKTELSNLTKNLIVLPPKHGGGVEVWPNHNFLKKEMFLAESYPGQNPNLFWKSLWLAPLIVTKCTFFGAKLQNFSRLIFAQFIIGAIMVQVFIFYILYFLVLASPRSGINFTERCSQGWLSQWACTLHAYNSK